MKVFLFYLLSAKAGGTSRELPPLAPSPSHIAHIVRSYRIHMSCYLHYKRDIHAVRFSVSVTTDKQNTNDSSTSLL